MMRVASDVALNVRKDPVQLLVKYEREVEELKQELAMHNSLAERSTVQYDPYTAEQRGELRAQVQRFLEDERLVAGSVEPLELTSLRHMREVWPWR